MKFKISDETLNGSNEEINTEQNGVAGGARPKVIQNKLVEGASGPKMGRCRSFQYLIFSMDLTLHVIILVHSFA